MADLDRTMLRGLWYLAATSTKVGRGKSCPVTVLCVELILVRLSSGTVLAYADCCPHRGMPLRHGSFDGTQISCCYHGWRFEASTGTCAAIPALPLTDKTPPDRFRLRSFLCREVQGNIWVFIPADRTIPAELPDVPTIPGFEDAKPQVSVTLRFQSNADIAAISLCDPAHPAFVHTSGWWKSTAALALRPKTKAFEPIRHGFRMKEHALKEGANPYRLLGTDVRVSISVQLPGLRIEHIRGSRHAACVLTAATPVSPTQTDVHCCIYWTMPWLTPLRPIATWLARDFLRQDQAVACKLSHGPDTPSMLFVGDPDRQIAWLLRLKQEFLASQAEGRMFENPLHDQTLQWRS